MKSKTDEKDSKKKDKKPPKAAKPKTEEYIMKKNTGMKVLRTIFWIMLIFIFIRGVASIFKTDTQKQAEQLIQNFKDQYNDFTSENAEIMAFAQNFTKEYLTYETREEEEYKSRLKPYVTSGLLTGSLVDCTADAEAGYVQAYRIEDYTEDQKDVYVFAEVYYTSRSLNEDGQTYTTSETKNTVTLRVPVYVKGGSYIIEDLPLMVDDESIYIPEYKTEPYYGNAVSDEKAAAIKTSVENFLKAYFEQDESVINYYLGSDSDKEKFSGLNGRFSFVNIEKIDSYLDSHNNIVCIVEFKIKDTENNVKMLQKINLSMTESGGKFYIQDINLRTGNLNIK
ncbi:MAG: conjugal transfer protein [Lachnospiraceae bacterium]